ncbi:MAG TPA: cobalamin-dependent protein [Thermoanaerobaculia bacterium]|jgi:methanogenic corrinoid protein MtbC1|nr:cobalamin-dependent protein [Thermoanaerobaculia bacterium]
MNEIRANIDLLARDVTEQHAQLQPELFVRYGPIGKFRCREDARFHLERLAAAIELSTPPLFIEYIAWTKVVLTTRGIAAADLAQNLRILEEVLLQRVTGAAGAAASAIIRAALNAFPSMPADVPSHIDPATELGRTAESYLEHLLRGRASAAAALVRETLAQGESIVEVYRGVLEPAQREVGRLWQLNQVTVAQEHYCTATTIRLVSELSASSRSDTPNRQTLVAMCAAGEQHDLGLRLLTNVLESEGRRTLYLGANVPAEAAVAMCVDQRADLLLISATVPVHIPAVAETIRLFRAAPTLASSRVIVGGAAFQTHPRLWQHVGADAFARSSKECLALLDGAG